MPPEIGRVLLPSRKRRTVCEVAHAADDKTPTQAGQGWSSSGQASTAGPAHDETMAAAAELILLTPQPQLFLMHATLDARRVGRSSRRAAARLKLKPANLHCVGRDRRSNRGDLASVD